MKNTYNPPAFSKSAFYHDAGGCDEPNEGMTLRDYFAAKAMQGMVTEDHDSYKDSTIETLAKGAYRIADAMLKERSK
jgi:hypothetical protein